MQNKILKPYTGLSLRKGTKEVNIHYVKDGVVHWGLYEDGDELPHGLHRCDIRTAMNLGATYEHKRMD